MNKNFNNFLSELSDRLVFLDGQHIFSLAVSGDLICRIIAISIFTKNIDYNHAIDSIKMDGTLDIIINYIHENMNDAIIGLAHLFEATVPDIDNKETH